MQPRQSTLRLHLAPMLGKFSRAARWGTQVLYANDRADGVEIDRPRSRTKAALALTVISVAIAALLNSAKPAGAAPPQMTVAGQFEVSAAGAASYSMPILVPPGSAGMVPSLSLNYSSQSGNGILGFGWSLGGLPAVTRCPQTVAQDNLHATVNYDGYDRFCLDGQRLLVVVGAYGADGSEYRTEIESFSKVVAHNTTGVSGPGWFEVHTKAGQIIELGNSVDSRILAQGKTAARVWAANKISDTVGNYLTVTYVNDTTNGQFYPDHILYTGNTGVSPYNSVYFGYDDRADLAQVYHAGSMVKTTKLLSHIKTYNNNTGTGTAVTDYRLEYQLNNAPFSQLISVKRCDGAGACLAPTSFEWQTATTWSTRVDVESMPAIPGTITWATWVAADFNGDGVPDGAGWYSGSNCGAIEYLPLLLNTPAGFVPANMTESYTGNPGSLACLQGQGYFGLSSAGSLPDFDADGLSDMTVDIIWPICACTLRNDGQGHFAQVGSDTSGQAAGLDINGDGRSDFIKSDPNTFTYTFWYGQGDGTYTLSAPHPLGGTQSDPARLQLEDLDGDGCVDVIFQGSDNEARPSCNPGLASYAIPSYGSQLNGTLKSGDYNGDGNTDIVYIPSNGSNATLNLSTGASLVSATVSGLTDGTPTHEFYTGDFNGDGKIDVAMVLPHYLKIFSWQTNTLTLANTISIDLPQYGCNGSCSPPAFNGTIQTADVDADGCTDLVIHQDDNSITPHDWYIKFKCHPPLLMTSISNGIGAKTQIVYDRLNKNQPLYTKCVDNPSTYACGDVYPIQGVDGPIYVVKQVDTSNGLGVCTPVDQAQGANCFTTTYAYAGAKNDLSGRGFLGFQKVVATNLTTSVVQTTLYNTLFPLTGTVLEQTTTFGAYALSDTTNSYQSLPAVPVQGTPTFVYLASSHTSSQEADGTALPSTTTSHLDSGGAPCYDTYGNPACITVSVSDGSSKSTVNIYSNDPVHWILGHLSSTTVTGTVGSSVITRTSTFAYNPSNGVLTQEVMEPDATGCNGDNTACKLQTDYGLDAFGHHTSATVSGAGIATRTSYTGYDPNGRFVTSTTDALSHQETIDYSGAGGASFGAPTSHTDLNSHITTYGYDSFGRRTLETLPGSTGVKTAASYQFCSGVNNGTASCPANGAYMVQITPYAHDGTTQNGPMTRTYYDALSRVIATDAEGFDGPSSGCTVSAPCWIRSETKYEAHGFIDSASRPYFVSGGTAKWTVYEYAGDPFGRPHTVTAPDAGTTLYAYTGLGDQGTQTTVTDANTHATTTKTNAQGLTRAVVDARNKTMSYAYDAYGDLIGVTDTLGNQIVNSYDIRGNKLTTDDPDVGHWTYTYDALGELRTQTDPNEAANGTHTVLSYDLLGRVTQRIEPDLTSNWTYDTASNGIGLLAAASGSAASYSRTHFYDTLSRPTQVTLGISGSNVNYTRSYNTDGRLDTLTYPSGLVVKYVYTPLGYLQQLKDNASGAVLWTANLRDAEMHLADQIAGNGAGAVETISLYDPNTGLVQQIRAAPQGVDDGSVANLSYGFDKVGNLSSRTDNHGASENFCYDPLDRLKNYSVGGTTCTTGTAKTVSYDGIGNITNKSDLAGSGSGNYSYPASGAGSVRPHAVKSITGLVNGLLNPKYKYDANGNLTCMYTGANCTGAGIIRDTNTYWSFDMTKTVSEGTTNLTLTYDSEHARITQALTSGGATTTTSYLNDPIHGAMGEKVVSGSATTWNDYLIADGRMVGERSTVGGVSSWSYFVLDHLGSVAVTTDGASGAVGARQSFDPWGRRRNQDGTDNTACAPSGTAATTRGYTGQEQLDAFCLVNLNARLYDPTIARMMSADSVVSRPTDPQSYNRYSYVDNRPLSDPTGHIGDTPFDQGCLGSCSYPNMTVIGGFSITETVLGDGNVRFSIQYNSNGEQSIAQSDTAKSAAGVASKANSNTRHADSPSDPHDTSQTASAQNADSVQVTASTVASSDKYLNWDGTVNKDAWPKPPNAVTRTPELVSDATDIASTIDVTRNERALSRHWDGTLFEGPTLGQDGSGCQRGSGVAFCLHTHEVHEYGGVLATMPQVQIQKARLDFGEGDYLPLMKGTLNFLLNWKRELKVLEYTPENGYTSTLIGVVPYKKD